MGISDEAIQKKLLSEPDLIYNQAVEAARADLREINKPLRPIKTEPVHRVRMYTESERDSVAKLVLKDI